MWYPPRLPCVVPAACVAGSVARPWWSGSWVRPGGGGCFSPLGVFVLSVCFSYFGCCGFVSCSFASLSSARSFFRFLVADGLPFSVCAGGRRWFWSRALGLVAAPVSRGFALVGAPSGVVSFVGGRWRSSWALRPFVVGVRRARFALRCWLASFAGSPRGALSSGSLRFPPAVPVSFPLPSGFGSVVVGSAAWRCWVASVASAPVSAGAGALSSSCCGSVLLLSSPAFVSSVLGGSCPVALALASFSGWPLRSGVLGALCAAGRAGALSAGVARAGFAPVLRSFLAVALPSLGVSSPSGLRAVWSGGALPPLPSWVGSPSVCFGLFGVRSAFSRLSSCLGWLRSRGASCPPACRPLLACLCAWCFRALAS